MDGFFNEDLRGAAGTDGQGCASLQRNARFVQSVVSFAEAFSPPQRRRFRGDAGWKREHVRRIR
jgi:hypothetical protein